MQEILKILVPILVAQVAIFLAIVFLIKRLLLNDTMKAVDKIKQVEADVRKKEESIRKQIEEHEQEFARKKAEAEETLQKQREQSEKEVGKLRDQVIAEARRESDSIIENARKNEDKFRKQLMQETEEKSVEYGVEAFRLVFSDKLGQEINRHFVNELLDAIGDIDASSITADSADAEFKCSHPMETDQRDRLEALLKDKFKVDVKVNEKLEPSLIAGLVFKLGSLEIDGSLISRLQEAAAEVKKSIRL